MQAFANIPSFREIMVAIGQIPDKLFGFDAAGVVRRVGAGVTKYQVGDNVAMYGHGSHRTIHRSKASYCAPIPNGLSFEQAATVPVVHGTAWYGLIQLARIEKGQSILIHAAAGGVGQSAIQIAKHFELEIFATVGSEAKRQLIRDEYGVPDDHILNSRDLSFVKCIKRMTGGRGVDVVLNSLSGEALRQTWHCIAPFGTFVEIGIKDILDNTELDMRPFLQDATYTFFNLNHIERDRPEVMAKIIAGAFDFQERGITRPITPLKTYPIAEVENAFRLMQAGKHIGKVALTFSDEDVVPVLKKSADSFQLDHDSAYMIVGGFGGLGRSISNMLVDHGARKLAFLSRSGGSSAEAKKLIQELEDRQVKVAAYACDIADPVAASRAIRDCMTDFGTIRGVIQSAMLLRDVLFSKMTYTEWIQSIRPKVQGTWNLHQNLKDIDFSRLARILPPLTRYARRHPRCRADAASRGARGERHYRVPARVGGDVRCARVRATRAPQALHQGRHQPRHCAPSSHWSRNRRVSHRSRHLHALLPRRQRALQHHGENRRTRQVRRRWCQR